MDKTWAFHSEIYNLRRMMEGVNITIVSTFVNITVYPQYNSNIMKKREMYNLLGEQLLCGSVT
jgi:hypothetical protein